MPLIETSVGSLYYTDHERGPSTHPPLILIHGAGGSRLDWPGELRRLPDVRVISLDLPGHGKSPEPGRKTIMDYAMVVTAFMDAASLPQAIIMGHSMGGAIAQMMSLETPQYVAGLILIGTGARLHVDHRILERILIDQEEVARLLTNWFWSDKTESALRNATLQQVMVASAKVMYDDYYACNNFDVMDQLGEIKTPALVISGTEDRMTPSRYGLFLQQNIPDAQLVNIEGGGHMMALEHPQQVADTVKKWIVEQFHATT